MSKNNFQSKVSKASTRYRQKKLLEMDILMQIPPTAYKPYPILLKYQKFVDKEIKLLRATGCRSKGLSPWAAPIIIISKKSDPKQPDKLLFQMVLDYRQLNKAINSAHNSDKLFLITHS